MSSSLLKLEILDSRDAIVISVDPSALDLRAAVNIVGKQASHRRFAALWITAITGCADERQFQPEKGGSGIGPSEG